MCHWLSSNHHIFNTVSLNTCWICWMDHLNMKYQSLICSNTQHAMQYTIPFYFLYQYMHATIFVILVSRNVKQLVDELSVTLDAPSKKSLWGFILPRMSPEHRDYVLRHVDFPHHQMQGMFILLFSLLWCTTKVLKNC